jgi:hypothetical protein
MIIVIKSNRVIAKQLQSRIKKVSNSALISTGSTSWVPFGTDEIKNDIINILLTYKKQRFEVCSFTDKQLGLTVNKIGFTGLIEYTKKVEAMPLKYVFYWYFNNNLGRQSCTPISKMQHKNIIHINKYSDKEARKMYLNFFNEFLILTIDRFAEYYGISRNEAMNVINQAKTYKNK